MPEKYSPMPARERELRDALLNLIAQVREDVPLFNGTRHLWEAVWDAERTLRGDNDEP